MTFTVLLLTHCKRTGLFGRQFAMTCLCSVCIHQICDQRSVRHLSDEYMSLKFKVCYDITMPPVTSGIIMSESLCNLGKICLSRDGNSLNETIVLITVTEVFRLSSRFNGQTGPCAAYGPAECQPSGRPSLGSPKRSRCNPG